MILLTARNGRRTLAKALAVLDQVHAAALRHTRGHCANTRAHTTEQRMYIVNRSTTFTFLTHALRFHAHPTHTQVSRLRALRHAALARRWAVQARHVVTLAVLEADAALCGIGGSSSGSVGREDQ